MRILVTGSRSWDDRSVIYRALAEASEGVSHDEIVLVHGGARGADEIAAHFASAYDWGVEGHDPLWIVYGRKAGIIRNMEMADAGADICLAFIKDGSPGATQCAVYAESKGIPVKRYLA
jgi:hypothetical protein